jgi:hypothetical protein
MDLAAQVFLVQVSTQEEGFDRLAEFGPIPREGLESALPRTTLLRLNVRPIDGQNGLRFTRNLHQIANVAFRSLKRTFSGIVISIGDDRLAVECVSQLDAPWRREAGFAISRRAMGTSEVRFAFFTPLPEKSVWHGACE